jgi:aryl-alcohol dehydrogenase-like predicted oxidoreductase
MKRVALGSSGIEVSPLCMGSMQMGWTATEAESFEVLDAFVAAGGNFIDTADIYSRWVPGNHGGDAETIIGNWMQARGNRDQMVVATKARGRLWPGPDGEGLGRKHLLRSVDGSLKRLKAGHIDLFQCHWFDENTPIEETLDTFAELIAEGKIRAVGLSNYPPDRFAEAIAAGATGGRPAIASLQPHHSLVHRGEFEGSLQSLCLEHNIAVMPYSPLASGFLTGKYRKSGPKVGPRSMPSSKWRARTQPHRPPWRSRGNLRNRRSPRRSWAPTTPRNSPSSSRHSNSNSPPPTFNASMPPANRFSSAAIPTPAPERQRSVRCPIPASSSCAPGRAAPYPPRRAGRPPTKPRARTHATPSGSSRRRYRRTHGGRNSTSTAG